jgi:hypothetical protein
MSRFDVVSWNGVGRGSSPLLDSFTAVQLARDGLPYAVVAVSYGVPGKSSPRISSLVKRAAK